MKKSTLIHLLLVGAAMGLLLFFVKQEVQPVVANGLLHAFASLRFEPTYVLVSVIFDLILITLQAIIWAFILKKLDIEHASLVAASSLAVTAAILAIPYMLLAFLLPAASLLAFKILIQPVVSCVIGAIALPLIANGLRKVTNLRIVKGVWIVTVALLILAPATYVGSLVILSGDWSHFMAR